MRNNMRMYAIFLPIMLAFIAGLSVFVVHVLSRNISIPYLWIPFVLFPVLLLATTMLGNAIRSNPLNDSIYTFSVFWIPVLLYLFMGSIVIGIVSLFTVPAIVLHLIVWVLFALIILILASGTWNATHPKIKTYSLSAPLLKEKWGDKKIVLISDVHLGMVTKKEWMQHIAGKINTIGADIVFIAGDLADGPKFNYATDLAPLGSIKTTFGIYYTAGNHDEYNQEQEKYYAELEKYVTVLNDKKTMVNDTQIVGVMYAHDGVSETKDRLFATGYQKEIPSIGMLHDPKNISAFAEAGISLALSGHTHAGQFFPFTLLVRSIYKELTQGIHYIESMAHVTSVGVGTAGPRLRFGTTPEIALITIE